MVVSEDDRLPLRRCFWYNQGMEVEKMTVSKLQEILDENRDKRVVVIGTTGTGKSTFVEHIKNAKDMDALLYPQLTPEEIAYIEQTPWTPEIGNTMIRLAKERIKVMSGAPVFGTVVLDTDLLVLLKINDGLLRERTQKRGIQFEDARNMQKQIEEEAQKSGIPTIEFLIE